MSDLDSADPPSGVIFDLQRWSTEDGPGIRTTVFFKGCPLRCLWCCNPESWSPQPQLGLFPDRCRGCGVCVRICPEGAARPALEGRHGCPAIGQCVAACPHGARQRFGQSLSADAVLAAVARDQAFHRRSGGGITFSGGEPAGQPGLLAYLSERLSGTGTHLALETCGQFSWSANEAALRRMDLIHFDLKHMDPAEHQRLTGVGNALILDNAVRVARAGIPMIIRVPLVPGLNDSTENLAQTARFVVTRLGPSVPVELMPYHRLGRAKFHALGLTYTLESLEPPTAEQVQRAKKALEDGGARVLP